MPNYTYKCHNKHEWTRTERMLYSSGVVCDCGSEAWRVPTCTRINWNGPKPSKGEIGPSIKSLIDNQDENRDKLAHLKEIHVRQSAQEEAQHANND